MTKKIFMLIVITIFVSSVFTESLILTDKKSYTVTVGVSLENQGLNLSKVVVIFPIPESNIYQNIRLKDIGSGEIFSYNNSQGKYIRFTLTEATLENRRIDVSYSFEVDLYSIETDFDNPQFSPMDTEVQQYLGDSGNQIIALPEIKRIADTLWLEARDELRYTELCYDYVATQYFYRDPNTGIHPLEDILRKNGGDCGNLTSIFVSLLRAKDIPAKHLVTVRPDGSFHAWADIFHEDFGWIPVDVTYKNSNRRGNFFGIVDVENNGIIVSEGLNHTVQIDDENSYTAPLVQSFLYWYWGGGSGDLGAEYYVETK